MVLHRLQRSECSGAECAAVKVSTGGNHVHEGTHPVRDVNIAQAVQARSVCPWRAVDHAVYPTRMSFEADR